MELTHYFEQYLQKESLFSDKSVLLSSYVPEEIKYREEQTQEIANILAPLLKQQKPSNLFIYGKTGTGKTVSMKNIIFSLEKISKTNNLPLKFIYINCKLKKVADTEYRLIAQLIKECGKEVPVTGLPTDEVYSFFYALLDEKEQHLLLVLDEIDHLTQKIGDEILYNLTRINTEFKKAQISLVGISNNLNFADHLDPRVKSSLSGEEIIFPPYNAFQIQDILQKRSLSAFKPGTLETGVIEKCSAYAAREHGDARRAIDLLRIAGEVAERNGSTTIGLLHLDDAEKKIETDKIIITAMAQPKQAQVVLYSILLLSSQKKMIYTGEVYEIYKTLCRRSKLNILTQRRLSDLLGELDMLGIINAKIMSKGRYGRTRELSLPLDENTIIKLNELLEKSLQLN